MTRLNWPVEQATLSERELPRYSQYESLRLDLHDDPVHASLVVFSDGNHHMALQYILQAFSFAHPEMGQIFYTTTPPCIATEILRAGGLAIGNFCLSVTPHVLISPPAVLLPLVEEGHMQDFRPFMRSRGVVLLVHRDNPKGIAGITDLLRSDERLLLSNPITEKVSNQIDTDCLWQLAVQRGITLGFLAHVPRHFDSAKLVYGESIHHREAPQAIMDERADAALVFYHLALRYSDCVNKCVIVPIMPSSSLNGEVR